jgi:hypothetical protein
MKILNILFEIEWRITKPFKRFFQGLKWFKYGLSDYDWDYVFLYSTIDYKLKNMEKNIRKGNTLTRQSKGRMIKYIRKNLKILINNEIPEIEKLYEKFFDKYGDTNFECEEINNDKNYIDIYA